MINGKAFILAFALILLAACNTDSPLVPHDSREAAPTPPLVAVDTLPTPTTESSTGDAGGYARAFFRAWEGGDYIGMYGLLSLRSQTLVDSAAFVERYQTAMRTATTYQVHAQPLSLVQQGNTAEFGVRITWETYNVGAIVRDHTVPMTFENGRWGVEWDEGLILPELAGGNRLTMEYRIPSRANVYDINGKALAFQGNVISLGIIPGQIQDEAALLATLTPIIGKTAEEIQALYASALPDWFVPIGDITEDTMQAFGLDLQPFIGAGLAQPTARPARIYTESGVAPHIVGYVGAVPAEQLGSYLEQGYRGDEIVGLSGVEAWGESYLKGEVGGVLSLLGLNNEFIQVVAEKDSLQARSVYTTIDRDFQQAVEQALAEAINSHPIGQAGAVVVLDVNTGAVRAMASYPTYNPVIFDAVRPSAAVDLGAVLSSPGRPLLNRAAQGAYPAGSVFKIVTFSAAVNSDLYTPETRYNSTGVWSRLGEQFAKTDWLSGGHGYISLRHALVVSCNSCFYDAGYTMDGLDNTLLPNMAHAFGLGQRSDIVGIAESAGLIPDPAWKINNVGEGWATGDAVNMSIGQGYVQVTPLQIANMAATVANGGTLYQPTLIDRIGAAAGAPEEAWPVVDNGRLPLSSEHIAAIRQGLWDAANSSFGTSTHRFEGLAVPVAGKTGTAEAPPLNSHAWFTGYAPAAPFTQADGTLIEQPEIAIAVIVENAGEGSAVAAPIFRRVIELYYGITPLAPYPW